MSQVVVQRRWIDEADAPEGQALLPLHIRVLVNQSDGQRMGACGRDTRRHEAADIGSADGAVAKASRWGVDLDERFEPEHATRTGPHNLKAMGRKGRGDFVCTE